MGGSNDELEDLTDRLVDNMEWQSAQKRARS